MKTLLQLAIAASLLTTSLHAQDPKQKQEELEAKFKAAMTGVILAGNWTPLKDGELGEAKPDKYAIVGVEKLNGDAWVIHARMNYKQQEFVAPIPVAVKWAGDTAVIVVDNMVIPRPGAGGTAYSARVLIHDGTYAGTWSGGDHGGLMNGVIVKDTAAPAK